MKHSRLFGQALLLIFILIISYHYFSRSLFFYRPERLNIVMYDAQSTVYSLSQTDKVHYQSQFGSDTKILLPHGYRYYRIGALGKLIQYDKRPEIIQQSFSLATSTFVHYYFYSGDDTVFHQVAKAKTIVLPKLSSILWYKSNASLLDRIYILYMFTTTKRGDFSVLNTERSTERKGGDYVFNESDFAKQHLGFFYHKSYRKERRTVQILYTKSYSTAVMIGRIFEGSGIRVADISQQNKSDVCIIIESGKHSITATNIATFFECKLKTGNTNTHDIIFQLGKKEEVWGL